MSQPAAKVEATGDRSAEEVLTTAREQVADAATTATSGIWQQGKIPQQPAKETDRYVGAAVGGGISPHEPGAGGAH
jgi:hypothetical protein